MPEGRRLFPSLTVEENLLIGGHARKTPGAWTLDRVYALFPILQQRRAGAGADAVRRPAADGGDRSRADVQSAHAACATRSASDWRRSSSRDIYAALPRIKAEGTSVVLVEQDIVQAMKVADRVYCFQEGRLSLEGRPRDLSREQIHRAYFGS